MKAGAVSASATSPVPRACSIVRSPCGAARRTSTSLARPSSPRPSRCASTGCGGPPRRTSPRRACECGALESVIAEVERLVAEQPGRERAWGLLMRALYAAGRQHDALVAFQRARRALVDGFGLDPGPGTAGDGAPHPGAGPGADRSARVGGAGRFASRLGPSSSAATLSGRGSSTAGVPPVRGLDSCGSCWARPTPDGHVWRPSSPRRRASTAARWCTSAARRGSNSHRA